MKGKITDTWTFKLNTVIQIGFSSLVEESFNLAQLVVTSPPYRKCSLCHANHKQFKIINLKRPWMVCNLQISITNRFAAV